MMRVPFTAMSRPEQKANLIRRAKRQKAEILQIFRDAEYWNLCVRKPDQSRLDPDPDGEMCRWLAECESVIDGSAFTDQGSR